MGDARAQGRPAAQGGGSGRNEAEVQRELEESNASALMADEMLANAMARGEPVDLDRQHEESLAAAAELDPPAGGEDAQGRR